MRLHISEWEYRSIHDVITDLIDTINVQGNILPKQLVLSLLQEVKVRASRLEAKVDLTMDYDDLILKRDKLIKEVRQIEKLLPEGDD